MVRNSHYLKLFIDLARYISLSIVRELELNYVFIHISKKSALSKNMYKLVGIKFGVFFACFDSDWKT
jgi:hypothetical protein